MEVSEANRLKALEDENAKLKKPCLRDLIGGGFIPSRRGPRKPLNSCGTMTQHGKFQRQIGSGFGSFRPCLMPPTFPMILPP
jgi:hypothetical protein